MMKRYTRLMMMVAMMMGTALMIAGCGKGEEADAAKITAPEPGTTIVSNKRLPASSTNYCTQYSNEACGFLGGQVLKFSDGTVFIGVGWEYLLVDGGGDTDSDTNSTSGFVPPNSTGIAVRLNKWVARGSGYRSVFFVYTRSPELFRLVHDTNNNGALDDADTVLSSIIPTDW